MRYFAFISYSHRDDAWGAPLHHALETIRVPRPLVGREGSHGPVPQRAYPVFRDREELPGSSDLGLNITAALEDSAYLVVLCSPRSARSHWVNEEVLSFRRLGKGDRIIAVLIDGEPGSADPDRECLPAALRDEPAPHVIDGRGRKPAARPVCLDILALLVGCDEAELRTLDRARMRHRSLLRRAAAAVLVAALGWTAWQLYELETQRWQSEASAAAEAALQLAAEGLARDALHALYPYIPGLGASARRPWLREVETTATRAYNELDEVRVLASLDADVESLAADPSGRRILVETGEGIVLVDRDAPGRVTPIPPPGPEGRRLRWSLYSWGPAGNSLSLAASHVRDDGEAVAVVQSWRRADSGWTTEGPIEREDLWLVSDFRLTGAPGGRVLGRDSEGRLALVSMEDGREIARGSESHARLGWLDAAGDGAFLVDGPDDGVFVVPVDDVKLVRLEGSDAPRRSVRFVQGGARVALLGEDGALSLHEREDGGTLWRTETGIAGGTLTVSPDGDLLMVGRYGWGGGGGVRVVDASTGAIVAEADRITGYHGSGRELELSPDATRLLAVASHRIAICQVLQPTVCQEGPDVAGLREARFVDGAEGLVYADDDRRLNYAPVRTERVMAVSLGDDRLEAVWSAAGSDTMVALAEHGALLAWQVGDPEAAVQGHLPGQAERYRIMGALEGGERAILVERSADGARRCDLFVVGRDGSSGEPALTGMDCHNAVLDPSSRHLAARVASDSVTVVRLPSGEPLWSVAASDRPTVLALSAGGSKLLTQSGRDVSWWQREGEAGRRTVLSGPEAWGSRTGVFLSETRVATLVERTLDIHIEGSSDPESRHTLDLDGSAYSLTAHGTGDVLVLEADYSDQVVLVDARQGSVLASLPGHTFLAPVPGPDESVRIATYRRGSGERHGVSVHDLAPHGELWDEGCVDRSAFFVEAHVDRARGRILTVHGDAACLRDIEEGTLLGRWDGNGFLSDDGTWLFQTRYDAGSGDRSAAAIRLPADQRELARAIDNALEGDVFHD